MYKADLKASADAVEKVVRFVADNKAPSRSQIAARCGVNIKSVAEIVDFFIDRSLFVKSLRSEKTVSGMRPERIRLDPKYNCAVYTVSDFNCRADLINADGKILISEHTAGLHSRLTADRFLSLAGSFEKKCAEIYSAHRFGTGVVCSGRTLFGEPCALDAARETLAGLLRSVSNVKRLSIDARDELVRSYVSRSDEYRGMNVIYICLNRNEIHPTAAANESVSDEARAKAAKMMTDVRDSFDDAVTGDEVAALILRAYTETNKLFPVQRIILDSEELATIEGLALILRESFRDDEAFGENGVPGIVWLSHKKPTLPEQASAARLKAIFAGDVIRKLYS